MAMDAISSSDAVLFVVDGRVGLTPEDIDWARLVRRKTRAPVLLLVNKSESNRRLGDVHEFYKLGFGEPVLISAEHKNGFDEIKNALTLNEIGIDLIDHHVFRILAWKYFKGIMMEEK